MGYIVFVLSLLGLIILIFIFQYINSRKSDKILLLKLKENYGKADNSSYDLKRLASASGYFDKHKKAHCLDDITWSDLSMDEIFTKIDSTQSDMGTEVLYHILKSPLYDSGEITQRQNTIEFWQQNEALRLDVLLALHQCRRSKRYSFYNTINELCTLDNQKTQSYIFNILLLFLSIICMFFSSQIGIIVFIIVLIINYSRYYRDKNAIMPYINVFGRVLRLIEVADTISNLCQKSSNTDISASLDKTRRKLDSYKRSAILTNLFQNDGNPITIIFNIVGSLFFADIIIFNCAKKKLIDSIDDIDDLYYEVGYIDACIAISSYVCSLGERCCKWTESDKDIVVENIYHPLITNPVANSVTASRSLLLTGSNASGKSSFLKSIALGFVFGQTFGYCLADNFIARISYIYSTMSLRDNVSLGDSYYMAEIKAIKRILDAYSDKDARISFVCFVDELLSGTNTEERIAAATQILKTMSVGGINVFAATHDIELTELLNNEYDNYHFSEELVDGDVRFTYKLQAGAATTRNAIKLLARLDFPANIINEAEDMVNKHSITGNWTMKEG